MESCRMKTNEIVAALGRLKVETGSISCLGCGHEESCDEIGCAVIQAAIDEISTPVTPVINWEIVMPVRHGEWELVLAEGYVTTKKSRAKKRCSCCGWVNACRFKFCPNCGAKMDLEGEK